MNQPIQNYICSTKNFWFPSVKEFYYIFFRNEIEPKLTLLSLPSTLDNTIFDRNKQTRNYVIFIARNLFVVDFN